MIPRSSYNSEDSISNLLKHLKYPSLPLTNHTNPQQTDAALISKIKNKWFLKTILHALIPSRISPAQFVQAFRQSPTKQMKQNDKICDTFQKQKISTKSPPLPLPMLLLFPASIFLTNIEWGCGGLFHLLLSGIVFGTYCYHQEYIGKRIYSISFR